MEKIIDVLSEQWIYDIEIMSKGWVVWSIIPALLYFVFMIFKWIILTLPILLPATIIAGAFKFNKG